MCTDFVIWRGCLTICHLFKKLKLVFASIGHFRVRKTLTFKMRLARCTTFLVKMSFICMRMKNNFHIKDWAPKLVLKQRPGGTRKWPIEMHPTTVSSCIHWKHSSGSSWVLFRSLEMHSKRRYKICICSVILGELDSLRNYRGVQFCYLRQNWFLSVATDGLTFSSFNAIPEKITKKLL